MGTTKNTNNSLSDLNNSGYKFNKLLNNQQISSPQLGNSNSNSENQANSDSINANIKNYQIEYQNASDDEERSSIQANIDSLQQQLNTIPSNQTNDFQSFDGDHNAVPTSLFDRDAFIDYAKYINSDGTTISNWKEYYLLQTSGIPNTNNPNDFNPDTKNFTVNNKKPINEPVALLDNSLMDNNKFSAEGLSIPNLIAWSEKYPALQLRFQDFIYCKRLGYYPNNRLIILRRFKGGVPDNLFDYYNTYSKLEFSQPLATMITWLKPDEEIIDLSFNETWEEYDIGLLQTLKSAISFSDKKEKDKKNKNTVELSEGTDDLLTTMAIQQLVGTDDNFSREDGVPFTRNMAGNPNLIRNAQKRKTGGDGLESKLEFTLNFEYEMRYVNNVDPGIAMLDLMSNSMRMGTSESEFRFNIPFLKNNDAIKSIIQGDISKLSSTFKDDIKKMTDQIQNLLTSSFQQLKSAISQTSVVQNLINLSTKSLEYIISRYREDLKSALSVDTGLPSGIWHVTIGNPKNPIVSCGDLIITKSKLKLGKELGYNDFPNSFEVEYELESARERGRNELIRILNSGRGRLYVYPNTKKNPDYDLY